MIEANQANKSNQSSNDPKGELQGLLANQNFNWWFLLGQKILSHVSRQMADVQSLPYVQHFSKTLAGV